MSLNIGTALSDGFRRTFSRNGLVLAVVFVLIGVVSAVALQTILADVGEFVAGVMRENPGPGDDQFTRQDIRMFRTAVEAQTPFALPVPTSVAGLLIVCTAVLAETTRLVTARVFFGESNRALSGGVLRRNIVLATLNGIVGGIVVGVLIAIGGVLGLILLVIGGPIVALFLAVSFLFLRQEIAVEDKNFVDAMADSWSLAKGNRLELFVLVLGVVVIAGVASFVPSFVVGLASPTAGTVVGWVVGGVTAVFGTGVVTRAYAQLHAERAAEKGHTTDERAAY